MGHHSEDFCLLSSLISSQEHSFLSQSLPVGTNTFTRTASPVSSKRTWGWAWQMSICGGSLHLAQSTTKLTGCPRDRSCGAIQKGWWQESHGHGTQGFKMEERQLISNSMAKKWRRRNPSDVSWTRAAGAGSTALEGESEPACLVFCSQEGELYTKHTVLQASQMASNLLQARGMLVAPKRPTLPKVPPKIQVLAIWRRQRGTEEQMELAEAMLDHRTPWLACYLSRPPDQCPASLGIRIHSPFPSCLNTEGQDGGGSAPFCASNRPWAAGGIWLFLPHGHGRNMGQEAVFWGCRLF